MPLVTLDSKLASVLAILSEATESVLALHKSDPNLNLAVLTVDPAYSKQGHTYQYGNLVFNVDGNQEKTIFVKVLVMRIMLSRRTETWIPMTIVIKAGNDFTLSYEIDRKTGGPLDVVQSGVYPYEA